MNPQCARCGKVVYPTEKVNCLDKVRGRGRAGGDGASRVCPLPSAPAGRAGPGWAGGGAGRACRWQMRRLRGCRCPGIRGDSRRITALAKGGVRAGPRRAEEPVPCPPCGSEGALGQRRVPAARPRLSEGRSCRRPPPGCSCQRLPELGRFRLPLTPRPPRRGRWPGQLGGDNPVPRGVPR